jgi:hypothetical protein
MGRCGGGLIMALTIKHREDGTFYEQGDTQGLMIPADVLECYAYITYADAALLEIGTTITKIPVAYSEGQQWVNSANEIVVPETGYYLIDHIIYYRGIATNPQDRYSSVYRNGSDNILASTVEMSSVTASSWTNPHFAGVRKLNAGDKLTLRAWVGNGTVYLKGGHLRATLLKNMVTDFVANKGALVSGSLPGEIKIDSDTGKMKLIDTWTNITSDFKANLTSSVFDWKTESAGIFNVMKFGQLVIVNFGGESNPNKVAITSGLTVATLTKYKPRVTIQGSLTITYLGISAVFSFDTDGLMKIWHTDSHAVGTIWPAGQLVYLTND